MKLNKYIYIYILHAEIVNYRVMGAGFDEAIYADDELPNDQIEFIEINLKLSEVYENITESNRHEYP